MVRGTTTQPTRVSQRIANIKEKAAKAAIAAAAEATNQVAVQKRKREADPAPPAKRARTSGNSSKQKPAPKSVPKAKAIPKPKVAPRANVAPTPAPILTQPAAEKLKVFNFGTGEYCELGLGPKSNAKIVKRPRLNAFLDIEKVGVVGIAYGGMHGAAITHDGKVYTWGVNDLGALGRVTKANEVKMKDADDSSDSDDEDDVLLNEDESTPKLVDLPEGTVITRISCCDSATFVVTETGLVYGWGTFRVRHFRRSFLCFLTNLFLVEGWCARFLG
jgi:regulator of chromosome condensation